MHTALVIIQVLVAVGVIALVLLQQGKGADAGAAFGAGASGTVFGSRGSSTFLSRATGILAAVFMLVSLALAYLVNDRALSDSVVDRMSAPAAEQQQQTLPPTDEPPMTAPEPSEGPPEMVPPEGEVQAPPADPTSPAIPE